MRCAYSASGLFLCFYCSSGDNGMPESRQLAGLLPCNEKSMTPWMTRLFIFGLGIGFYDGFFGPGTGTFWTIALVTLLGLNLKKATAQTKVMNFTSNIVSLAVFYGNHTFCCRLLMDLPTYRSIYGLKYGY